MPTKKPQYTNKDSYAGAGVGAYTGLPQYAPLQKQPNNTEAVARAATNSYLNNGGNTKTATEMGQRITGNSNWQLTSDNAYKGSTSNYSVAKNPNSIYNQYWNAKSAYGGFGGGGSLSRIGGFQPSEAYNQAMAYTQSLLDQLNSGRTAYSDKVDALMAKIEGREKFSYDFNTDPLFQNALASAMASGQTAMQDTIGQASALTGGYGSSYATSAANQTYNEFVKGAYDKLPDYYNIALNAYNMEGQDLYNQLGMYREADNTAYSRLANAYSANLANADSMYNREYSNYWDTANYNRAVDEFNANMAYKNASLKASASNNAIKALYNTSSAKTTNAAEKKAEEQTAEGRKSIMSDSKLLDTGKNLALSGGTGEGSDYEYWLYQMDQKGYDTEEIDRYIMSMMPRELGTVQYNGFGTSDNVYTDQYGYLYDYENYKKYLK